MKEKNFIDDYNAIKVLYYHEIIDNHEANALKDTLLINIIKRLTQDGEDSEERTN